MKYRATITCGLGFASLEEDYDKRWEVVVVDENRGFESLDLEEFKQYHESLLKRYRVVCKHCGEVINLPRADRDINTSVETYMQFNRFDYNHSVKVTETDVVIQPNDEVIDVTEIASNKLSNTKMEKLREERSEQTRLIGIWIKLVISSLIVIGLLHTVAQFFK